MKAKALATIEKYNMIEQGETVAVGFSGGADSVALLYLLYECQNIWDIELVAVHLNHLLRGEESFRDEAFSREFCKRLDIKFSSAEVSIENIAKKKGMSVEEAARVERYKLYSKAAPNSKVATAHTLTDSLETVLINLTRGTGIEGLTGIPPVREGIIRPLIECTRQDIEEYCRTNSLDFIIDSTNLGEKYTRNKIRHKVVPRLKEINPKIEETALNMIGLLQNDSDFLSTTAHEAKLELKAPEGYRRKKLLELPPAILSRVIKELLLEHDLAISYDRAQLVEYNIRSLKKGLQLSEDLFLDCSEDFFDIVKIPEAIPSFCIEYSIEDENNLSTIQVYNEKYIDFMVYDCKESENNWNNYPNRLKNLLDYDKIESVIKLRQRTAGDSFQPAYRGCTKSLKKLFNEEKIPLHIRDSLVIIESNGQIAWIEGFGTSELAQVSSTTKKVLEILIK